MRRIVVGATSLGGPALLRVPNGSAYIYSSWLYLTIRGGGGGEPLPVVPRHFSPWQIRHRIFLRKADLPLWITSRSEDRTVIDMMLDSAGKTKSMVDYQVVLTTNYSIGLATELEIVVSILLIVRSQVGASMVAGG